MTAENWVICRIKELVSSFPHIRVRYENHTLSNTHFLEIVPHSIFHINEKYKEWEEKLTFEFIQKFPNQNICFISDDAIVGLDHIDFEEKGSLFDFHYSENIMSYHPIEKVNFEKGKVDFFDSSPVVTGNLQVNAALKGLSLNYSINHLVEIPTLAYQEIILQSLVDSTGENTYAMAA